MKEELAQLSSTRAILLGLPISEEVGTEVIAKMLFLKSSNPHLPIQLIVNSPGGSVATGLAIIKTMDELGLPIRVHGLRFCGGLATTVLAHGTPGMRTASPDCVISLSKVWSGNGDGRTADQINSHLERLTQSLVVCMTNDTSQTWFQIRSDMEAEKSFTAAEAKAYGFIDQVATPSISS